MTGAPGNGTTGAPGDSDPMIAGEGGIPRRGRAQI